MTTSHNSKQSEGMKIVAFCVSIAVFIGLLILGYKITNALHLGLFIYYPDYDVDPESNSESTTLFWFILVAAGMISWRVYHAICSSSISQISLVKWNYWVGGICACAVWGTVWDQVRIHAGSGFLSFVSFILQWGGFIWMYNWVQGQIWHYQKPTASSIKAVAPETELTPRQKKLIQRTREQRPHWKDLTDRDILSMVEHIYADEEID